MKALPLPRFIPISIGISLGILWIVSTLPFKKNNLKND
jgi:hypothetical protein